MSDRLDCPECEGTGREHFGPLQFICRFCRGRGYVGDDNEPADRDETASTEVDPMDAVPVWADPVTQRLPGCRVCLGSGRVINLGGDVRGGVPAELVEAPCPACSTPLR